MSVLEQVFRATEEENRRVILSAIAPRPGGTLLDLGCGTGEVTMRVAAAAQVDRVLGVEFVDEVAELARGNGVEVAVADLSARLPYADASIDVIHSNQVIEHLQRTDHFFREIRRLLKPDGYAVVSTNNLASWHNVGALVAGFQPSPCHVSDEVVVGNPTNFADGDAAPIPGQTHLRIFTGQAMAALAAHHGLEAELQLAAGYYPLPPRVARRFARADPRHGAFLVHQYRVARG